MGVSGCAEDGYERTVTGAFQRSPMTPRVKHLEAKALCVGEDSFDIFLWMPGPHEYRVFVARPTVNSVFTVLT